MGLLAPTILLISAPIVSIYYWLNIVFLLLNLYFYLFLFFLLSFFDFYWFDLFFSLQFWFRDLLDFLFRLFQFLLLLIFSKFLQLPVKLKRVFSGKSLIVLLLKLLKNTQKLHILLITSFRLQPGGNPILSPGSHSQKKSVFRIRKSKKDFTSP